MEARIIMSAAAIATLSGALGGCAGAQAGRARFDRGEFAAARTEVESSSHNGNSREVYRLNQLTLLGCAEGLAAHADEHAEQSFERQRVHGGERLAIDASMPKGEPFEQAMAFYYVALQRALIGDWGNARAAAGESLFRLKDFRNDEQRRSGEVLGKQQLVNAKLATRVKGKGETEWIDHGYQPSDTDFVLGYILHAIASDALGRADEASDNLRRVAQLDPNLRGVVRDLQDPDLNTVLIVEYGAAPAKVGTGPDGVIAAFHEVTPTDSTPLVVGVAGRTRSVPWAMDLNTVARDHRWQSLDDVREGWSKLGRGIEAAGVVAQHLGASGFGGDDAQWIGLAAQAVGLAVRAASRADSNQDGFLPQRVYVAAVRVGRPDSTLTLQLGEDGATRISLPGVDPPGDARRQVLYVRIPTQPAPGATWLDPAGVLYSSDSQADGVPGRDLPYILGGRDVRTPTPAVLAEYHAAGWLQGMTLDDLRALYRAEGIALDEAEQARLKGKHALHVLEGGCSLAAPAVGSIGFNRLMCAEHRAYTPRTKEVRRIRNAVLAMRRESRDTRVASRTDAPPGR